MHERPSPDLGFSDPTQIAKFLGDGWEKGEDSNFFYEFTRTERETQRMLQLSFPTHPGGLFIATIPDGPKFFLMGVIAVRLIPPVSNFPKVAVVEGDRATFSLETESLMAEFRPLGDSASHVMVDFKNELRRPSVG